LAAANKQIGNKRGRGRPPGAKNAKTLEIEAAAREYAGDALAALLEIATTGDSEPARVSAATALLDRGYGRPRQSMEHSGPNGGPIPLQVWKFGKREVAF